MNIKEKFNNKCLELTNLNIDNKMLKEILSNYILNNNIEITESSISKRTLGYKLLLLKLKDITCEELNWDFICNVTNSDFEQEINILDINKYNDGYINSCICLAKVTLEQIYIHIIKDTHNTLENINVLKKSLNLFELGKVNKQNEYSDIPFIKSIKSKYPLNSNIEAIYQYSYKGIRGKQIYTNVNLNTNNKFLIQLLSEFIEYERQIGEQDPIYISHLFFYYLFENSLENNKISSLTDFNSNTFKIQYKFYNEKEALLNKHRVVYLLKRLLIHFYSFIDKKLKDDNIEYDIFYDNWINIRLLCKNSFCEAYEEGYVYIEHNAMEDYPKGDLWWLFSENEMTKSAAMGKIYGSKLDFTVFEESIKNQVKDYIWNGPSMLKSRVKHVFYLKEFFNFAYDYIDFGEKIDISFELIWDYNIWLASIYDNDSTLANRYTAIKNFINFNKGKYNISKRTLDILKPVLEEKDGTPITLEDFKILEKEFKGLCENKRYKYGKLLYYIFMIAATSNLRLGEIISLQRNCIIYKDNNGNGTIRALRKSSKKKYIESEYPESIITLVEMAKAETEQLSHLADKELKNYIFLVKHKNIIDLLGGQFTIAFSRAVMRNAEQLSRKYTAYNLRHTFINYVYDEINTGKLTIRKAIQSTGNARTTVLKNYRRNVELIEYAKAMDGILISNVDIQGNIINKDQDILIKEPCDCNRNECISSILCLACKHFITTLSKISKFEKQITELEDELKNINDSHRKKELELELNLLRAYLLNVPKLT